MQLKPTTILDFIDNIADCLIVIHNYRHFVSLINYISNILDYIDNIADYLSVFHNYRHVVTLIDDDIGNDGLSDFWWGDVRFGYINNERV